MLVNVLTGKWVIAMSQGCKANMPEWGAVKGGKGTIRAGEGTIRAG